MERPGARTESEALNACSEYYGASMSSQLWKKIHWSMPHCFCNRGAFGICPVVQATSPAEETQPSQIVYPTSQTPGWVIGILSDRDLPVAGCGACPSGAVARPPGARSDASPGHHRQLRYSGRVRRQSDGGKCYRCLPWSPMKKHAVPRHHYRNDPLPRAGPAHGGTASQALGCGCCCAAMIQPAGADFAASGQHHIPLAGLLTEPVDAEVAGHHRCACAPLTQSLVATTQDAGVEVEQPAPCRGALR